MVEKAGFTPAIVPDYLTRGVTNDQAAREPAN